MKYKQNIKTKRNYNFWVSLLLFNIEIIRKMSLWFKEICIELK